MASSINFAFRCSRQDCRTFAIAAGHKRLLRIAVFLLFHLEATRNLPRRKSSKINTPSVAPRCIKIELILRFSFISYPLDCVPHRLASLCCWGRWAERGSCEPSEFIQKLKQRCFLLLSLLGASGRAFKFVTGLFLVVTKWAEPFSRS
jgi:hypothetical protein